jgi:hypothetical protein
MLDPCEECEEWESDFAVGAELRQGSEWEPVNVHCCSICLPAVIENFHVLSPRDIRDSCTVKRLD